MTKTSRIVACRVGQEPVVETLNLTLGPMQHFVGGYIEAVRLDNHLILWCNEEGRILGLPVNRRLGPGINIYGDFFVAASDADGREIGLTEAQATQVLGYLKKLPGPLTLCESGDVTGVRCEEQDARRLVVVRYVPLYQRETAKAAGTWKGLVRAINCCEACADMFADSDDAQWFEREQ
ncbi:MAG: DUF3846 domain-containing protein [Kiloniellales bacterium]|nr:DUF3846 domain-containing protein [Kiloniellales bacterium]